MIKKEIPSEVLEQARRLCALSDDPTAALYEIENALQEAHRILLPYGLSVEDIINEVIPSDVIGESINISGRHRRTLWLDALMDNVAWFTDTQILVKSGWEGIAYTFMGLLPDTQRAKFHSQTLYEQMEYYGECRAPRNIKDIRSYKQGIADRIKVTMQELKYKPDAPSSDVLSSMAHKLLDEMTASRVVVLVPVKCGLQELYHRGFTLAKIDGKIHRLNPTNFIPTDKSVVEAVVDSITIPENRSAVVPRLMHGLENAFDISGGVVYAEDADTLKRTIIRAKKTAPVRLSGAQRTRINRFIRAVISSRYERTAYNLQSSISPLDVDYRTGYIHGAEIQIEKS